MRSVRIVDRSSAQQHGLVPVSGAPASRRQDDEPGKPSVDEKRSYYWNGPGWIAAYNEAKRLLATGLAVDRVAPQIGWSKEQLEEALRSGGVPPEPKPGSDDEFKPRERPRRTVKQRVAGLHGVSVEKQRLARHYYEVEIMTVREVAKALNEPYEKTYLILILAKTKFRRPGRRAAGVVEPMGAEESVVKTVPARVVEPKIQETRPAAKRDERKRKPETRRPARASEAEKALRRVLGPQGLTTKGRPVGPRKKLTDAEKAFRRVLG